MAGNTFGKVFRITTWGESHGSAIGVVLDGCPAGLRISETDIQNELDRRRPGQSKVTTQRKEADKVEILSGVFKGKTLGTPISMLVRNTDVISSSYEKIKDTYRPGHADFTYDEKYGFRDYRGGGRASARETAGRVAAGAIAKKLLEKRGIKTRGFVRSVGDIVAEKVNFSEIEKNPVRCPDAKKAKQMFDLIDSVRRQGDSVGGTVEVITQGLPAGLGEPVFHKLDADLASALMSIGGIRGFEVGSGFDVAKKKGSEVNDLMFKRKDGSLGFKTNNAGGLLGGITNGENLVVRIAIKPTSSISKTQKTVDKKGSPKNLVVKGRHDPCLCPRAVPIAEAMVNLVLADHILMSRTAKL
ncbi:MAG: chorismate synthase [Candidatus Mycalebacterium zealandia]|nr:MAG: chorismate synthase [Candidatus Mycalebacterium zealandia]